MANDYAGWGGIRGAAERYALTPVRLLVGYGFLQHGIAKWSKGPAAFAGILHAAGVPAPHMMAAVTIATEILGGIAILLGCVCRVGECAGDHPDAGGDLYGASAVWVQLDQADGDRERKGAVRAARL